MPTIIGSNQRQLRGLFALAWLIACTLRAASAQTTGPKADPALYLDEHSLWSVAIPALTQLPNHITQTLRQQDVLSYVAPGVAFPARNIGLQCQGVNATLADIPQRNALVKTTNNRSELRFGETDFDGFRVFRLQVSARDILTSGSASRCELISYPMPESALPNGEDFWWAMSFWADDWSGSQDEQLIAQFHVQEPSNSPLNPFFALVVRGNSMRVELRHNSRALATRTAPQLVTAARLRMPVRQWVTAVVQARISADEKNFPFLRLWLNNILIADYTGPLGYLLPTGGVSYAKAGIYHWVAGNDWDVAVPTRAILIGAMVLARDSGGRYTAENVAAVVGPRTSR